MGLERERRGGGGGGGAGLACDLISDEQKNNGHSLLINIQLKAIFC